jgi:hypothetical protein
VDTLGLTITAITAITAISVFIIYFYYHYNNYNVTAFLKQLFISCYSEAQHAWGRYFSS